MTAHHCLEKSRLTQCLKNYFWWRRSTTENTHKESSLLTSCQYCIHCMIKLPYTYQWLNEISASGNQFSLVLFFFSFFFSFFLQFLCSVAWVWMLCVFQSTYVNVAHVGKFYDSLVLNISFSIKSQILVIAVLCVSSRSCVSCFSSFALYQWVGFSDIVCDSCCENVLHMQMNQNLG